MNDNNKILNLDLDPDGAVKITHKGDTRWLDKTDIISLLDTAPESPHKGSVSHSEPFSSKVRGRYSIGAIGRKISAILRLKSEGEDYSKALGGLYDYLRKWDKVIADRPVSNVIVNLAKIQKLKELKLEEYAELRKEVEMFIPKYQSLEADNLPKNPRPRKKKRR